MTTKQRKILIIDDEEAVRELLKHRISNEGYHCEVASDAKEALNKLLNNTIELVIMDIKMPGKSGMDFLLEIRQRFPDVLIIMITVISDIHTAIECIRRGAYDYLTKPFILDEVVLSVKRGMDKRRLDMKLQNYKQHLEQKLKEQVKELREISLGAMVGLSFALEAKDSYIAGHSRRVADIATAIGTKLNLKKDQLEDLRWGSLLHDIGKIAVDQAIMNKPGKLSAKEYECVMTHTIVGASLVGPVARNKRITEVVEHHHAHYDGNRFNQKLSGQDIPLLARIVALADAYDAMTSIRPYRAALSRKEALAEIRRQSGKQFDSLVVNALLEMLPSDIGTGKRTILVVDDEASIRLLLRSTLGNDYMVIEASNGQEAVDIAISLKPSLILMDIIMPYNDGLQACYEIKANPITRNIPVVMLTSTGQELDRRLCAGSCADQYITKPFSNSYLLDTISKLLT